MPLASSLKNRGQAGPKTSQLARPWHRKLRLLIVEDDPSIRAASAAVANQIGFDAELAGSLADARTVLREQTIDLVLLDVRLGGESGLTLLDEVRAQLSIPIVVTTAFATVSSAIAALRAEVFDYIEKPFSVQELVAALEGAASQALANRFQQTALEPSGGEADVARLLGISPAIQRLRRIADRVASASHPVLIQGEPGTETEILARSIHINGPASLAPFRSVDCSRFSRDELEDLLFGYSPRRESIITSEASGILLADSGGTVFLSEVDRFPLDLQSALLSALEKKAVQPPSCSQMVPVTTRIITACSKSLAEMINSGAFRRDLFSRLNMINLRIPPLRERKVDIPVLSMVTLDRLSTTSNRSCKLAKNLVRHLMDYEWPGNSAQLENAIEFAYLVSGGNEIRLSDMPDEIQQYASARVNLLCRDQSTHQYDAGISNRASSHGSRVVQPIAKMERKAIMDAVEQMNGDKLLAAKLLGIGKTTLYRKLKEYETGDGASGVPN